MATPQPAATTRGGPGSCCTWAPSWTCPRSAQPTGPSSPPGSSPARTGADTSPLSLEGAELACWVRTAAGVRPVVAHAAWRTDAEVAAAVALASSSGVRTPLPLRESRRLAREARARRRRP